ncbi:MAG TPA: glycosyltransferase family 2 protein [Nitriliruptorales bacterium]|nr:glycosyltransferase family 2 protein [Nitriliruptorales bacterium]
MAGDVPPMADDPARPAVSAVIPVHDEVAALPDFHAELMAALPAWSDGRVELIYVDDGSTDGTADLLEKLHADAPDVVRVVTLRRNFGKSGALAAGFSHARGEVMVTLDADGQDVPSEVPKLLARLAQGADLVGGWRRQRSDRTTKRWASRVYNAATRALTGLPLHDFNAGIKALRREVAEELPLYGEFHRFVPVLAHDLGFRVEEVTVTHRPRRAGTSKYLSFARFPKTLLDLLTVVFLTRFADRPLYLFGGFGLAMSLLGGAAIGYLVVLKLFTGAGIGTRPLLQLGVVTLLVGVQLVLVGFLGDVLRHTAAAREPPYRVRRTLP